MRSGETVMIRGSRLSDVIVGGVIGLGIIYAIWSLVSWQWALALLLLLTYEGYTLINNHPNDTLSESVWRLAKRPLVPFLFGVGVGYFFPDDLLYIAIGLLVGHFLWQAQGIYEGGK